MSPPTMSSMDAVAQVSSDQPVSAITLFELIALPEELNITTNNNIFFKVHIGNSYARATISKSQIDIRQSEKDSKLLGQLPHAIQDDIAITFDFKDINRIIKKHYLKSPALLDIRFELLLSLPDDMLQHRADILHTEATQFTMEAETLPLALHLIW
jgi:hypothetical protein